MSFVEFNGGSLGIASGATAAVSSFNGGVANNQGLLTIGSLNGGSLGIASAATAAVTSFNGGAANNQGLLTIATLNGGLITNSGSITATTLSNGTINGGEITAAGGNFQGSLIGAATLNTNGTLSFGSSAILGSAVQYNVASSGSVSFVEFNGGSLGIASGATAAVTSFNRGAANNQGLLTIATLNGGSITNSGSITATTLSNGTINGGEITAAGGNFGGSLIGAASLNTTGILTVGSSATLGSAVRYKVANTGSLSFLESRTLGLVTNQGALTFTGRGEIANITNSGTVNFVAGGSISSQSGLGTVRVSGGALAVTSGTGRLFVGTLASAGYSAKSSFTDVDNSGALTLAADSSIDSVRSTGSLTHTGTLTVSGAGSIATLGGGSSTSFVKNGTGTLSLGGTYAGSTLVGGGLLSLGKGVNLLGTVTLTGGSLSLDLGARLQGNVTVAGGYLLLGGSNQFGGDLTLTNGVIDLGGNSKLTAGAFTATGGIFGVPGATGELSANSLNITGGTMNASVLQASGTQSSGNQSFGSGTVVLKTIGKESNRVPELSLNGSLVRVKTETLFAGSVSLTGSGNSLEVTNSIHAEKILLTGSGNSLKVTSSNPAPESKELVIGGNNNSINFTNGFTPTSSGLVLTIGDATSSGGSLIVGGSGLSLSDTQTLKGRGTIVGNVFLGRGAVFAPGNSPGITHIIGDQTYGSGSKLEIEFDRSSLKQDQVEVTGGSVRVDSGAILEVKLGKGASRFRPGVNVLAPIFIDASNGALSTAGNFTSIIAPAGYGLSVSNGSLSFAGFRKSVGGEGNVAAVASQIDLALHAGVSGDSNKLATLIDNPAALASTDAATVKANLAALNPAFYAELGNIGIDRLRDIQAGISNHLDMLALSAAEGSSLSLGVKPGQGAAPESLMSSARAWTTAYGGWGKRNAESSLGASGYSSTNYGDVSGVETSVGVFTIGLTGAVGNTSANSSLGSVSTDSWLLGLYGSAPAGPVVFDAAVALGQTDSTVRRSINVAGGGGVTGKTQGSEWTGQVGFAVPLRLQSGSLILTPSVHVLHSSVSTDAVTESSLNGLEAAVLSNKATSTAMRMGLQAAKLSSLAQKPVRFTANIDWVHSFDSDRRDANVALTGAESTTSQFLSSKVGADAIRFGVGAELSVTDRIRLRVNIDDQRKSGTNSIYSSASIGLQF